ncbi:hypothetical protein MHY01S_16850 [Meiothermus hypogaeus NBRC 106114]|uniref:Uncharacterized protein n=3 Tax=Meiothermus hypogaeus TaxID=884155 RepID=A0A511R1N6_9DEIN|nr:hypothetical protein Mhypo_02455 [Meiothermus hypogaeus]GEM83519.1 hypothetical protein MHY01S_16850 [Meiothermus hypogaeus NBRC 106114]
MGMKKSLAACAFLFGLALAQTAPFTDQDRILNFLVSNHPTVIEGQAYIAVLQSTRVWVVNPGQSTDWRRPNFIYATAWYDRERNGLDPIQRIAFNGMPLQELSNRFGPSYALKQVPTESLFETWINWYAFFDPRFFPTYVSADDLYSQPRWTLAYPAPYRLNLPNPLRLGAVEWSFEMAPAYAIDRAPDYGSLKLYPSRTNPAQTPLAHLIANPGSVSRRIPPDGSLAGSGGGWVAGSLQGYAGASACNERSLDFGGGATVNKVLIKACTLVVSPVTFEVVAPR